MRARDCHGRGVQRLEADGEWISLPRIAVYWMLIVYQVVQEACGGRSLLIQQQNLFDIDMLIGDVVNEDEAKERLEAGWK